MTLIEKVAAEYERLQGIEHKITDGINAAVRKCVDADCRMEIIESDCRMNGADPCADYEWRYWSERCTASFAVLRALVSLEMDGDGVNDYIDELLDDERASRR